MDMHFLADAHPMHSLVPLKLFSYKTMSFVGGFPKLLSDPATFLFINQHPPRVALSSMDMPFLMAMHPTCNMPHKPTKVCPARKATNQNPESTGSNLLEGRGFSSF